VPDRATRRQAWATRAEGSGTARPLEVSASSHALIAISTSATASCGVSPTAEQYARSGTSATHESSSTLQNTLTCYAGAISYRGGRWQVSFSVRYLHGLPPRRPIARSARQGGIVGLDAGLTHLATLDRIVPGLTDDDGHIANPRVLETQLKKLAKLDRALSRTKVPSRTERGSKNRAKLHKRRARLHGKVATTRALYMHHLTNTLVDRFGAVVIEDLGVAAMSNRTRHLGRSMADASLGELRRQLTYKSADRGTALVLVDRHANLRM
jgi:putative transposase